MPPKKCSATSKKVESKKKEKVIEDKTFGLKNKKGAKQQKFIQIVEKQVKSGGQHNLLAPNAKKDEKDKKLKEAKEMAAIFKPVQTQKLEPGTDPKSVLCAFFKAGQCGKGDKCKFSHDLGVERKTEKRSIYCDMRDLENNDTMEGWTEDKLKEVVNKKQREDEQSMPPTTIICKYFLDAVEKSLYGWFWECPNGEKCIYRHALPSGYTLKKNKKKDDKKSDLSLYDLIESERSALGVNQTKVTLATFLAWKKKKLQDKKISDIKEEEKKRNDYKSGKQNGLSGRDMFSFNPELANDGMMDDGDEVFDSYNREEDDDDAQDYKELDLNMLSLEALEADDSGTVAANDRLEKLLHEQQAKVTENDAPDTVDAAPINENLFLDEDLEGLDDELNDLDLDGS